MPATRKQRLFLTPGDELFLLAVPIVGAVAVLAYFFAGSPGYFIYPTQQVADLLVGLLLLDTVHITYTFILVLGLPELRGWSEAPGGKRKPLFQRFWVRTALAALVLLPILYFSGFSSFARSGTWLAWIYVFLEAFAPSQHTLAQIRGISFCYHSVIRKSCALDKSQLARALVVERREKLLFRILLGADMIAAVPMYQVFGKLGLPGSTVLWTVSFCLISAAIAGILVNGALFPRQRETHKLLFLSRIGLYALRMFTPVARLVVRAIHGTEYFVILRNMVRNSQISPARRRNIYLITGAVTVIYGGLTVLTYPTLVRTFANWQEPSALFVSVMMVHVLIRYVHYYMDRVLYRMSDPDTRVAVAPLLVRMVPSAGAGSARPPSIAA